jgi:hypothetical protein
MNTYFENTLIKQISYFQTNEMTPNTGKNYVPSKADLLIVTAVAVSMSTNASGEV